MPELNRSDDAANLGPGQLTINQGEFREQQDVIGDSLLQLGGRGEVGPGETVNNPLNAPFVLYVNPYIGQDTIAFGNYATNDDDLESSLRRIEAQRLVCGYTEAAPFASLNRAIIEAGIITSKSYLNDAASIPFERVCIVLAPGTYDLNCGPGAAAGTVDQYVEGTTVVDDDFFLQFNPANVGGIILPRGCSVVSLDLRKTILRPGPNTVPAVADEAADYGNRRTMLRVTGEGYYYGLTFMDEADAAESHHLMSCFEFASEAQVDEFYTKITRAFSGVANSNMDNATTRDTEWQIVGPQPAVGALTEATDTTASASPYIYNCSIRSEFGLCGVFANGANVGGFRSMVIAQFTGVALQNDYNCWQQYNAGAWGGVGNFTQYRNADPDNIRMNPARRSFHVRAVNRAVIQEVSVFAIGQGIHHWTESGGELTITNSNSNFGGCAALSEGYHEEAPPQDTGFSATHQRVPTDLTEETNNIRRVYIGTIAAGTANNATALTLETALTGTENNEPEELNDYTFEPGSFLWVESPTTADYRSQLAAVGWNPANPDTLNVTAAMVTDNADGNASPGDDILNGGVDTGVDYPDLAGRRVYIRRLIDTRSQDERRYALLVEQPAAARTPQRDYIARIDGDGVGNAGAIDTAVLRAGPTQLTGQAVNRTQIEFKQINPNQAFRANSLYRPGDSIAVDNKHFICTRKVVSGGAIGAAFLADNFEENFAHMPEGNQGTGYMPEDFFKNVQPILIFDHDSDQAEASTTLGWILDAGTANNVWTGGGARNAAIQRQFSTATDFRGLERWLTNNGGIGIATPQARADRDVALAAAVNNVEFRRPSIIRMYGHAFEWAGFGNYTKALPQYQGGMGGANKFSYYGTNELGGRVYFTGFNEEGFSVSPRGIEDITTGEVLSSEEINAPDIELDIPTFFDQLNANTLTVNQELIINGTVSGTPNWGDTLPIATAGERGIVELATVAEAAAGTDTERAVTPVGLQGAVDNIQNDIAPRLLPAGVVMHTAGAAAPAGWLIANGDVVPNGVGTIQGVNADFSDLFAAVGTTYGAAGTLPDLQGVFLRGWTNQDAGAYNEASNPDPNRARGSRQNNAVEEHSHDVNQNPHTHSVFNQIGGAGNSVIGGNGGSNTSNQQSGAANADITIGDATGADTNANETRPTNIAMLTIIKI